MKTEYIGIISVLTIVVLAQPSTAATVRGTPHDLSAVRGGNACNHCHTPHSAMSVTPSWNHRLSTAVYKIYQSSSLEAKVGQPTGSSKLCLSCHDGTIALTATISGAATDGAYISPGSANLGTDLSDDHPISFVYSAELSAMDVQLRQASFLPKQLKLDRSGELQCTTCHDAHNNQYGDFLVMLNQRSAMCTTCHNLHGWTISSHESSTASVLSANDPYLQSSKYGTVSNSACLSCHRPHSAGGHERLLHFARSEDNCLNCHDGSVARTNLKPALSKVSRHDVKRYDRIHDIKESPTESAMHIECVDCHNPHAIRNTTAQAPLAPGVMRGIFGITASGSTTQQVQFEYEVCFKCHGDNPGRTESTITRQITQTNTRLEFSPSSHSFHPVVSPGVNSSVPSLKSPMTVGTMIYCTDCHNSDSSSGPKGPHGSNYSPLLAYNYETADFTQESAFAYELCYQCHSRNSILNGESFDKHERHLKEGIPCSACHDPHGISSAQGSATNNSHLINFDTSIVFEDPTTARREFIDKGKFSGECFLKCHDVEHSPKDY